MTTPPATEPHHIPGQWPQPDDSGRWFRRTLAVMAGVGLALAAWHLQQLLLVLFAEHWLA